MKKATEKSRYRLFGKITTLFEEINEELSCTGMKLCINSEYAPEYLKEAVNSMQKPGRLMKQCLFMAVDVAKLTTTSL